MSYFIIFTLLLFSFIVECKEFVLRCEAAKKNKVLVGFIQLLLENMCSKVFRFRKRIPFLYIKT